MTNFLYVQFISAISKWSLGKQGFIDTTICSCKFWKNVKCIKEEQLGERESKEVKKEGW